MRVGAGAVNPEGFRGQLAKAFGVNRARGRRFVIFGQCRFALFSQDFFDPKRKIKFGFFLVDFERGF